jgi:hypothetical protein
MPVIRRSQKNGAVEAPKNTAEEKLPLATPRGSRRRDEASGILSG